MGALSSRLAAAEKPRAGHPSNVPQVNGLPGRDAPQGKGYWDVRTSGLLWLSSSDER